MTVGMKPTKTLNIDPQLHREIKTAASVAGLQLADYAEALLRVGLSRPADVKRLLAGGTSSASPQGKA